MPDNILLIMMDDMRYDELRFMTKTMELLGGRNGTEYTWCHANVPLCSPSRAGIMTGQLSKHHTIVANDMNTAPVYPGNTFTAIGMQGYRVGCVGKFFTALAANTLGNADLAAFDYWRALKGETAYGIYDSVDYIITDGTTDSSPNEYQDHYLTGEAIDFMRGAEPWCLWYCPTSPHWPWQDPPNHQTEYGYRDWTIPIETDKSDQPTFIQSLPTPTYEQQRYIIDNERHRMRELQAADDSIAAFVHLIESTGQMDRTTIIFTSDNGNMIGEHGIFGLFADSTVINKNVPYEGAMHVPLLVRSPLFPVKTKVAIPTMHQDIVTTMLARAGANAQRPHQAGSSLLNIAVNQAAFANRGLLGYRDNSGDGLNLPNADIWTTARYKLVRWQGQTAANTYQLFDLLLDPNENTNIAYTNVALRTNLEEDMNTELAAP